MIPTIFMRNRGKINFNLILSILNNCILSYKFSNENNFFVADSSHIFQEDSKDTSFAGILLIVISGWQADQETGNDRDFKHWPGKPEISLSIGKKMHRDDTEIS